MKNGLPLGGDKITQDSQENCADAEDVESNERVLLAATGAQGETTAPCAVHTLEEARVDAML